MDKENNLLIDCYKYYDIVERNKISIITYDQIMHAELIMTLLCDCSYVYVETENHHLEGIISRGDFKNLFTVGKHLKTTFISLCLEADIEQLADKIYREKYIREIPVLNNEGELLYVIRRKKHIMCSFDFDWKLCEDLYIQNFFASAQNIYYLTDSQKIRGLKDKAFPFLEIKKIDNISKVTENDILICDWKDINNRIKSYSIDEVYLTTIAMSAMKYFLSKGIQYYFFQSPIDKKLRKEHMIYLKTEEDAWKEKDLLPFYKNYVKEMEYWLSKDYKNVNYTEIEKNIY